MSSSPLKFRANDKLILVGDELIKIYNTSMPMWPICPIIEIPLKDIMTIQLVDKGVKIIYRRRISGASFKIDSKLIEVDQNNAKKLYTEILGRIKKLRSIVEERKIEELKLPVYIADEQTFAMIDDKKLILYDPLVYRYYKKFKEGKLNLLLKLWAAIGAPTHPPIIIPLTEIEKVELKAKSPSDKYYVVELIYRDGNAARKWNLEFAQLNNARKFTNTLTKLLRIKRGAMKVEVKREPIQIQYAAVFMAAIMAISFYHLLAVIFEVPPVIALILAIALGAFLSLSIKYILSRIWRRKQR